MDPPFWNSFRTDSELNVKQSCSAGRVPRDPITPRVSGWADIWMWPPQKKSPIRFSSQLKNTELAYADRQTHVTKWLHLLSKKCNNNAILGFSWAHNVITCYRWWSLWITDYRKPSFCLFHNINVLIMGLGENNLPLCKSQPHKQKFSSIYLRGLRAWRIFTSPS